MGRLCSSVGLFTGAMGVYIGAGAGAEGGAQAVNIEQIGGQSVPCPYAPAIGVVIKKQYCAQVGTGTFVPVPY